MLTHVLEVGSPASWDRSRTGCGLVVTLDRVRSLVAVRVDALMQSTGRCASSAFSLQKAFHFYTRRAKLSHGRKQLTGHASESTTPIPHVRLVVDVDGFQIGRLGSVGTCRRICGDSWSINNWSGRCGWHSDRGPGEGYAVASASLQSYAMPLVAYSGRPHVRGPRARTGARRRIGVRSDPMHDAPGLPTGSIP